MSIDQSPVKRLNAMSELGIQIADSANLNETIQHISHCADALIGHRLFTVMAFDTDNRQVRRIFSNQPAAYPTGGIKTKGQSPWAKQVLDEGLPYIGLNANDIRRHFADHELIASLGLASVLNMPVRVAGRTLGTMNLLNAANYYGPDHLAPARILAGLLASSLLLHPSFE